MAAMKEFLTAFGDLEEMKRLQRQAQVDKACADAAEMLSNEAENFDAEASESVKRARDLRAHAAALDPPVEQFTKLDAQADAARGREEALWRAREDAIVSVKSQAEIARIDDHRARVQAELAQVDA